MTSSTPHALEVTVDQYEHRDLDELVIEQQILAACSGGPVRPSDVAKSIIRNGAEVRGLMMDLTHRGRLESEDGYATFGTVGSC